RSSNYRRGNLPVREGKLPEALEPFRIAVAGNSAILPGTLDLLWRASRGDVNALQTVTGNRPSDRLTLAQFLLKVERPVEAAAVFSSVDRAGRLALSRESSTFLNSLIAAGGLGEARDLWSEMAGGDRQS